MASSSLNPTLVANTPTQPDGAVIRLAVLLLLFGGDAAAWARFITDEGSASQRRDDLPLARAIATRCATDATLSRRLRSIAQSLQPG